MINYHIINVLLLVSARGYIITEFELRNKCLHSKASYFCVHMNSKLVFFPRNEQQHKTISEKNGRGRVFNC